MKFYTTPVFDFALLEDGRVVLFELGAGICGSGFSAYDFSHPLSVRHLMFQKLSAKAKNVFLVNVADNALLDVVDKEFVEKLGNIQHFEGLERFVKYLQKNPVKSEDSVIIIDRLTTTVGQLLENDYAEILAVNGIDIPVVNAGAYHLFDNKVMFPLLFKGELEHYIPQTYTINDKNYKVILDSIRKNSIDQFVLKAPASSHSTDTVIVSKNELKDLIMLLYASDKKNILQLNLAMTSSERLGAFIKKIDDADNTFIIRELVLPRPVQIGSQYYRCAGRIVFIAVFDDSTQKIDLDPIATYWRPAAQPYSKDTPLSYDNLISKVLQPPLGAQSSSMIRLPLEEVNQIKQENSTNTELTKEDYKHIYPLLESVVKKVMLRIVSKKPLEHITFLYNALEIDQAVKNYLSSHISYRACRFYESNRLDYLESKMREFHIYILSQVYFDIVAYKHFPNRKTLQKELFPKFEQLFPVILTNNRIADVVKAYHSMPKLSRKSLLDFLKSNAPLLFQFLTLSEKQSAEKIKNARTLHEKALAYYVQCNYQEALTTWYEVQKIFEFHDPVSKEHLVCLSNCASCFRNLENYDAAINCALYAKRIAFEIDDIFETAKIQKKLDECLQLKEQLLLHATPAQVRI